MTSLRISTLAATRAQAARALPAALVVCALAALTLGGPTQHASSAAPLAIVLLALAGMIARPFISWRASLTALLVVILFIPIRRYSIPVKLPFQLEPYRIVVFVLVAAWCAALLGDRRVRARRSGFEGPLRVVAAAAFLSVVANMDTVVALGSVVPKALTFLASFFLVFYVIVSVIRTRADVERVLRVLVGGGAVIAAFGIIESRTGFNPFNHLSQFVPFLVERGGGDLARNGQVRAFGPSEHPIALSAALAVLVPPALYLAQVSRQKRWWLTLIVLVVGALATISRTGLLMLVVSALAFLRLRPAETKRMWPLALVLLVATHFVLPGTLGTFRTVLFPAGGLVKQQQSSAGSCSSAGRIADLGPSFAQAAQKPLLGSGYGTRIVDGPRPNACILDDQWLGTLLEDGSVAVVGWLWLYVRVVRRLGRAAREDRSERGWLLVALAASLCSLAVGMITFDMFSFIQVTFILFVLLALAAVLLAPEGSGDREWLRAREAATPLGRGGPRARAPEAGAGFAGAARGR